MKIKSIQNALLVFIATIPLMGLCQNPLFIPDTLTGPSIDLSFQTGEVEFYEGFTTHTFGYNQAILGPTLILKKGEDIILNVTNDLTEPTTLHWHGLHVSAENDGGPHTVIEAGETWSPAFKVLDNAATYWYHPHLHERTEWHVTKGGAGFIIVRDEEEALLDLPRSYGIDDFPVAIQSRAFDADKQVVQQTAADDVMLINGTLDAFLDVPAQVVRLRLLNGSTERVYNFGFEGNIEFYQIATDGGLLDAPVTLTRLMLSPGERAEILLNMTGREDDSFNMMSFASEMPNGIYGATSPGGGQMSSIPGYDANDLNGSDFNIMRLNVVAQNENPVTDIPASLITNTPYSESDVMTTRSLLFRAKVMGPQNALTGPFVINGVSFDLEVINYEIPLDNIEVWQLTNMTAISHPFHIHDVQFYILDINGVAPPANMRGRKDVVLVPPMGSTVRFITKFDDHTSEVPYMYHCHMLSHEDDGMMGQFVVFDNASATNDQSGVEVTVYPNPTTDQVTLSGLMPSTIELYNMSGQLLDRRISKTGVEKFSLMNYQPGVYYFEVITLKERQTLSVVKN
ncbi:MAG: bilirubin oxidase [Bacteroidetes bacterium]|nr:MAG: bilirubin oxidase [Bacteroidota bacterium]